MPPTRNAPSSTSRNIKIIFVAFVSLLIVLSFYGKWDDFSKLYLEDTMNETLVIYGISRAINAGVSIIQSAELFSINFGEGLDPLNDAIERLSSGLIWAIGSLFVQKILLEIVSHEVFKFCVLISGVLAILAFIYDGWNRHLKSILQFCGISTLIVDQGRRTLVKVFFVLVLLRFIVPVFMSMSFLAVQVFLQPKIEEHSSKLSKLKEYVSESQSAIPNSEELANMRQNKLQQLEDIENKRSENSNQLETIVSRIDELNKERGLQRLVPQIISGKAPDDKLVALKKTHESLEENDRIFGSKISEIQEDLECIDKQLSGDDCKSLLGKVISTVGKGVAAISKSISWIASNTRELIEAITFILIAILVKNILFPIFFLAIAIKLTNPILKRLSDLKISVSKDLQEMKEDLQKITAGSGTETRQIGNTSGKD